MTYREALCISNASVMAKAMAKLVENDNHISYLETHVMVSKPIKRYLNNIDVAEEYAEKLGSYSIKEVDDYLKSLKEGK